ncbi:hypothetical protein UPYG_G00321930 [Umbra pygmaea]|uniref:Transmembrane protein 254 n=1 Tax=Umbra pygmaea TaxID=75934 RepID=A0ABD0WI02_UMBPY
MAKSDGCDYFRRTSLFWIFTVTLSMGYFTWVVFWPHQVPYDYFGPVGTLSKYLADNHYSLMYKGWWATWIIHLAEALFAMKVCSDIGVDSTVVRFLWFIQTVLYGFASLGLLLKYKREHRPKQQ